MFDDLLSLGGRKQEQRASNDAGPSRLVQPHCFVLLDDRDICSEPLFYGDLDFVIDLIGQDLHDQHGPFLSGLHECENKHQE